MVDQRKALAVTTALTDTVYFIPHTGIRPMNPWINIVPVEDGQGVGQCGGGGQQDHHGRAEAEGEKPKV